MLINILFTVSWFAFSAGLSYDYTSFRAKNLNCICAGNPHFYGRDEIYQMLSLMTKNGSVLHKTQKVEYGLLMHKKKVAQGCIPTWMGRQTDRCSWWPLPTGKKVTIKPLLTTGKSHYNDIAWDQKHQMQAKKCLNIRIKTVWKQWRVSGSVSICEGNPTISGYTIHIWQW